ncbi:MAG: LPS assembly lipoprotein LptE, partial [Bacteroidota bacterium]
AFLVYSIFNSTDMILKRYLLLLFFTYFFSGCFFYSFTGTSIRAEINSYYVEQFAVRAPDAIPTLGQTLSEALKDKIRAESNLKQTEIDPDIEFRGVVTNYMVTAEAPQAGETTAFNRLNVTIAIEYIDNLLEEKSWKENFTFFSDFPSDANLIDVQDALLDDINQQLIERIFNKAFNDW